MKEQINNTRYLMIGVLGTAFFMCFLLILFFIVKGHIKADELTKFGAAGDFFNGFIAPLIGAISAILVFIAFKQQVDQNRIQTERFENEIKTNSINRDFELYIKLIEDLEKYEQRIELKYYLEGEYEGSTHGIKSITEYMNYVDALFEGKPPMDIVHGEFFKSLTIHLSTVLFILKQIEKFKSEHLEFHTILRTKMILVNRNLYHEISSLIFYKDPIIKKGILGQRLVSNMEEINEQLHELIDE